jgi:hypothetical protein
MIGGETACDTVAEGVADHHCRPVAQCLDHRGDVARQIVQCDAVEPAGAVAHAPRLGQNRAVSGRDQTRGECVEVVAGSAKARQQQQRRPFAECPHRDVGPACGDTRVGERRHVFSMFQ